MHLIVCERSFGHGGNCVFDFSKPFIRLNFFQWCLINLFMVQIIHVYFWTLMINNIFCYILTLIPSGHQASSFLILGIESIIYK
jgi:hypothetical protein